MLEVLKTMEFWIALAAVAAIGAALGALKRYLRKLAVKYSKREKD